MFRRDYWVKGARRLSRFEADERLRALNVILTSDAKKLDLKVKGALGEGQMTESVYRPLLDILSDHEVYSLATLEQKLKGKLSFEQLREGLMILIGQGHVYPALNKEQTEQVKAKAQRLNQYLLNRAKSESIGYLCSPVIGGGELLSASLNSSFCLRLRRAGVAVKVKKRSPVKSLPPMYITCLKLRDRT